MKINRFLLLMLCLALLMGCGWSYNVMMGRRADGSPRISVGFTEDEEKNLTHRGSGMVFPALVAGFERDSVYIYDSHGSDVSVGYNLSLPECMIDVYIYPAYGDLEQHAAETKTTIASYHQNARLVSESPVSHEHAGTTYTGAAFTYRYRTKLKGGEQSVESATWLFVYGEWFIQYRMTYPESYTPEMDDRLSAFRDQLQWP